MNIIAYYNQLLSEYNEANNLVDEWNYNISERLTIENKVYKIINNWEKDKEDNILKKFTREEFFNLATKRVKSDKFLRLDKERTGFLDELKEFEAMTQVQDILEEIKRVLSTLEEKVKVDKLVYDGVKDKEDFENKFVKWNDLADRINKFMEEINAND